MEAINFLIYPFLVCIMLILIHVYFGIHILERGIIFVDLSLAQFIGLGIALSFLMGEEYRYLFSIIFAVIGASILTVSRRVARFVNIEAFIGVLYIFSLATSILILDRSPHGLEEFKTILNGNILWVTPKDVLNTCIIYSMVGILHFVFRKKFLSLSFEDDGNILWEFIFFLSFAIVLVKSVLIAGILQVFSFLLIPALIGRFYYKKKISSVLMLGWVIGFLVSLFGITLSYKLDLPTAPFIVASLSITFFLQLFVKTLQK
ncbi:MAG: metal ABC transporter permease [Nitrospinae bacterium]|nr:metal ABC transporter permease [Nitrospinota bacterium]